MIFIVIACLAVLANARSAPGNDTVEEMPGKNAPPAEQHQTTGKIYSDLIKIAERETEPKAYDTISYSQKEPQPSHESKIFILDNGKTYEVGQQQFNSPNPYLNAAISAVSAHLISQAGDEYIPFPPNGNPQDYPAYRGHGYLDSPLASAYERANRAGYGFYPTRQEHAHLNQQRSCYPSFYRGDAERLEFEDRGFPIRGAKEPIKRQILTSSFG